MRTLTIEAKSRDSAEGFHTAVKEFQPELVETGDGEFAVRIPVRKETDIVALLNALAGYVNERAGGPAVVALDDRKHVLHVVADPA